jgi:hypothetical protein
MQRYDLVRTLQNKFAFSNRIWYLYVSSSREDRLHSGKNKTSFGFSVHLHYLCREQIIFAANPLSVKEKYQTSINKSP